MAFTAEPVGRATFASSREFPSRKGKGEKSRFAPGTFPARQVESTPVRKYISRLRNIIFQRQASRIGNESIFDGLELRDRLIDLNLTMLAEVLMYLDRFPQASDGIPQPTSIEYNAFWEMLDNVSQGVQPEESKVELIQERVKAEAIRYIEFVRTSRAMYREQQSVLNRRVAV